MYLFFICFIAGIGAGLGTGFAGMSAAAVISPMLITFLGLPAYDAVGISLASLVPNTTMGSFSVSMTLLLGIKSIFIKYYYLILFLKIFSYNLKFKK